MISFRKFIDRQPKLIPLAEMSARRRWSTGNIEVSQPMANVLSLIGNGPQRSAAMQWLMTEGLYHASKGRDEMTARVNEIIGSMKGKTLQMQPKPGAPATSQQPLRPAMGEAVRDEFDFTYGQKKGQDPQHIFATDLFSPKAHRRIPELEQIDKGKMLDGMTFDEYFDAKYEPQFIELYIRGIEPGRYPLQEANKFLVSRGLRPFKYGGFNGYIEYLEQGDYLAPEEKRSHGDPNKKHGPDLSDPEIIEDEQGRQVYQFYGIPANNTDEQYETKLKELERSFKKIGAAIEKNGGFEGMPVTPEEGQAFSNIYHKDRNFERLEDNIPANKLANHVEIGKGGARGPEILPVKPEGLEEIVQAGLKGTFVADKQKFQLTPEQQNKLYNVIFNSDKRGVRLKWSWNAIVPEIRKGLDGIMSAVVNQAGVVDPSLIEKIRRVVYVMRGPGSDPSNFMRKQRYEEIPFSKYADQFERLGYKWRLNSKELAAGLKEPSFENGYAIISKGQDKHKVVKKPDGNLFVLKPLEDSFDKYEYPDDPMSRGWLGAGSGGKMGIPVGKQQGYIDANPARTKADFDKLYNQLTKDGAFGEPPAKSSSPFDLQSVKKGAERGMHYALQTKSFEVNGKKEIIDQKFIYDAFDGYQGVLSLALAGLHAMAGDHVFVYGYFTPADMATLKRFDKEKEIDKEMRVGTDEETVSGRGIYALFVKHKVPPAQHDFWIKKVEGMLDLLPNVVAQSENPNDKASFVPPEVLAAFNENAYEARVRRISYYVLRRIMNAKYRSMVERGGGGVKSQSSLAGNNDEGDADNIMGAGRTPTSQDYATVKDTGRVSFDKPPPDTTTFGAQQSPTAAPAQQSPFLKTKVSSQPIPQAPRPTAQPVKANPLGSRIKKLSAPDPLAEPESRTIPNDPLAGM